MSTEIITIIATIISANIALAGLTVGLFAWLRQDMKEQRGEIKEQRGEIKEQRGEIKEQGQKHSKEIEGVKIEVASLRATVETYFRVRVDPPPTAAVAEPPEDYGAD